MISTQIQIDLSTIFSFAALIIGFLTLWFSHLQGTDIQLCNIPETEIKDWTRDEITNNISKNEIPSMLFPKRLSGPGRN